MSEHEIGDGLPHLPEGPAGAPGTSRRGQVFTNPSTGERVVLLTDPETSPERALVGHLFVAPGGRVAAPQCR
jgi:hypothetical protein